MQFGSRASWEYTIEQVARARGLSIVVGRTGVRIPVSGDVDGFRVRCRFEDDPVRQPGDFDRLFCRVVEVPHKEFAWRDDQAFVDYIAGCFDKVVAEHQAERDELARIERELAQRAPWSPYPVGNGC